jgi:hypothetical protein
MHNGFFYASAELFVTGALEGAYVFVQGGTLVGNLVQLVLRRRQLFA